MKNEAFIKAFKEKLQSMMKAKVDRALDETINSILNDAQTSDGVTLKVEHHFSSEVIEFIHAMIG